MTLRNEQDLLARLYTDPALRLEFFDSPESVGRRFGVDAQHTRELAAASRDELEFFAQTLFWKRLNEVSRILPETRAALGDAFEPLFRGFSEWFVPNSVNKHLEDAYRFTEFALERCDRSQGRAIARERARLEFDAYGRRFVLNRRSRPFLQIRIWGRRFAV